MQSWKSILGFEGYYEVSCEGKIRSVKTGLVRKTNVTSCGYEKIILTKPGLRKTLTVHRLVAIAFLPNLENLPQVNHRDHNKLNNSLSNLEWITASNNTYAALIFGAYVPKKGTEVYCSRSSEETIIEIREKYAYENYTLEKLSVEFGYGIRHLCDIVRGVKWKSVGGPLSLDNNKRKRSRK